MSGYLPPKLAPDGNPNNVFNTTDYTYQFDSLNYLQGDTRYVKQSNYNPTIAGIDSSLNSLNSTVSSNSRHLSYIDTSISNIDNSLNILFADISLIDGSNNSINTNITNIDSSLNILFSDVNLIDNSFNTVNTSINTINSEVTTINTNITSIDSSLNILFSDVNLIDNSLNSINSSVSSNSSHLGYIDTDISNIDNSLNILFSDVNSIDSSLNFLNIIQQNQNLSLNSIQNEINTIDSSLNLYYHNVIDLSSNTQNTYSITQYNVFLTVTGTAWQYINLPTAICGSDQLSMGCFITIFNNCPSYLLIQATTSNFFVNEKIYGQYKVDSQYGLNNQSIFLATNAVIHFISNGSNWIAYGQELHLDSNNNLYTSSQSLGIQTLLRSPIYSLDVSGNANFDAVYLNNQNLSTTISGIDASLNDLNTRTNTNSTNISTLQTQCTNISYSNAYPPDISNNIVTHFNDIVEIDQGKIVYKSATSGGSIYNDYYTYTDQLTSLYPSGRIFVQDNGSFSCSFDFQTKNYGDPANNLISRLKILSEGGLLVNNTYTLPYYSGNSGNIAMFDTSNNIYWSNILSNFTTANNANEFTSNVLIDGNLYLGQAGAWLQSTLPNIISTNFNTDEFSSTSPVPVATIIVAQNSFCDILFNLTMDFYQYNNNYNETIWRTDPYIAPVQFTNTLQTVTLYIYKNGTLINTITLNVNQTISYYALPYLSQGYNSQITYFTTLSNIHIDNAFLTSQTTYTIYGSLIYTGTNLSGSTRGSTSGTPHYFADSTQSQFIFCSNTVSSSFTYQYSNSLGTSYTQGGLLVNQINTNYLNTENLAGLSCTFGFSSTNSMTIYGDCSMNNLYVTSNSHLYNGIDYSNSSLGQYLYLSGPFNPNTSSGGTTQNITLSNPGKYKILIAYINSKQDPNTNIFFDIYVGTVNTARISNTDYPTGFTINISPYNSNGFSINLAYPVGYNNWYCYYIQLY